MGFHKVQWLNYTVSYHSLVNFGSNSGVFVNSSSFDLRKEVWEILLSKQFWIKMGLLTIGREEHNVPLCTQSHCAIFLEAVLVCWPYLNTDRLKALNKLILLFESFNDSESQLVTLLHALLSYSMPKNCKWSWKFTMQIKPKKILLDFWEEDFWLQLQIYITNIYRFFLV